MSNDSRDFLKTINAFVDQSKANCDLVVKKASIDLLKELVNMSPVGKPELWGVNQNAAAYNAAVSDYNSSLRNDPSNLTQSGRLRKGLKVNDSMDIKKPEKYVGGRFRGNWQVSFDVPATGELDRNEKNDPKGSVTLQEGIEQLGRFTCGVQAIYFTNNLPYSVRLEFGHSTQAPNGIVRIAALNAATYFENAAKEVK